MKKALFLIAAFAVCWFAAGCGDKEAGREETVVRETNVIESAPGEEINEVIVYGNDDPDEDADKMFINSEFMANALEDSMQLDPKDIDFYQIPLFSKLDKKAFKYYMVSDVRIFGDISSLLILAASERENVCWLVNYDKNNRYIASLRVGYDELADGANGTDSVINLKGAPYYIELTNYALQSKENVKTEILASGKFNEISRMDAGDR
ncbi:MAG: hypothetical protein FWH43_04855 [Endomicrobia bacterium]|nr:hypothetical protein [Endomicrobiia bacterium]